MLQSIALVRQQVAAVLQVQMLMLMPIPMLMLSKLIKLMLRKICNQTDHADSVPNGQINVDADCRMITLLYGLSLVADAGIK